MGGQTAGFQFTAVTRDDSLGRSVSPSLAIRTEDDGVCIQGGRVVVCAANTYTGELQLYYPVQHFRRDCQLIRYGASVALLKRGDDIFTCFIA